MQSVIKNFFVKQFFFFRPTLKSVKKSLHKTHIFYLGLTKWLSEDGQFQEVNKIITINKHNIIDNNNLLITLIWTNGALQAITKNIIQTLSYNRTMHITAVIITNNNKYSLFFHSIHNSQNITNTFNHATYACIQSNHLKWWEWYFKCSYNRAMKITVIAKINKESLFLHYSCTKVKYNQKVQPWYKPSTTMGIVLYTFI